MTEGRCAGKSESLPPGAARCLFGARSLHKQEPVYSPLCGGWAERTPKRCCAWSLPALALIRGQTADRRRRNRRPWGSRTWCRRRQAARRGRSAQHKVAEAGVSRGGAYQGERPGGEGGWGARSGAAGSDGGGAVMRPVMGSSSTIGSLRGRWHVFPSLYWRAWLNSLGCAGGRTHPALAATPQAVGPTLLTAPQRRTWAK